MPACAVPSPHWATAVVADASDTAPAELRELGAHVSRCNGSRSRWFGVHCAVETVHDFIAPRFVTTMCIAGALLGLAALAL